MSNDARYDDATAGYYFREEDDRKLLLAFCEWHRCNAANIEPDDNDVATFLAERRKERQ